MLYGDNFLPKGSLSFCTFYAVKSTKIYKNQKSKKAKSEIFQWF